MTTILVRFAREAVEARTIASALAAISGIDVRFAGAEDEALAVAPEIDALLCDVVSDDFLARATRLRWVSFWGAGLDERFTRALAARTSVVVTNASGVHGPNIAEHVLGLMLTFTRRLDVYARAQIAREWRHVEAYDDGVDELTGRTLVIVGLGRIGEAIAARARPFGMRVVGIKRDPARRYDPSVVVDEVHGEGDLDGVLARGDHVAITLPLTPRTRHLFDATRLARMRRGAYLYNVGRGSVVDEAALVDALASGALGGAGLDVFEEEPLPQASPLWRLPNVIVTPHVSGVTPHYWERVARLFADNVARFVRGEPLENRFDPSRGY